MITGIGPALLWGWPVLRPDGIRAETAGLKARWLSDPQRLPI